MKIMRGLLSLLFTALSVMLSCSIANAKGIDCKAAKNELHCVIKFRTVTYQQDPAYFWTVLNKARDDALACNSAEKTAEFLQLVGVKTSIVELDEFISEGIETLCVDQYICFKKAQRLLNKQLRSKLVTKLSTPLYHESEDLESCR